MKTTHKITTMIDGIERYAEITITRNPKTSAITFSTDRLDYNLYWFDRFRKAIDANGLQGALSKRLRDSIDTIPKKSSWWLSTSYGGYIKHIPHELANELVDMIRSAYGTAICEAHGITTPKVTV